MTDQPKASDLVAEAREMVEEPQNVIDEIKRLAACQPDCTDEWNPRFLWDVAVDAVLLAGDAEKMQHMIRRLADELERLKRDADFCHKQAQITSKAHAETLLVLDQARAREAKLREALEWYANQNHYAYAGREGVIRVVRDRGHKARQALSEETP